jgi:CubicO group peptidase (beta-lactamase class C family)
MGGLITTIEDFSKYMNLHLSAWPPRDDPDQGPLKRSSIREMHQLSNFDGINTQYVFPNGRACPLAGGYGYGLNITRDCDNRLYVAHGGGLPGFGSYWRIMPQYGIGIVIFSNKTYHSFSNVTMPILDSLITLTGLKPKAPAPSKILEQRKHELMQMLPNWKAASASPIFAENFFPDNPIDKLRAKSEALFAKAGTIKTVSPVVPTNNLRGFFDVHGEKGSVRIFFTLSPETNPKIQAFKISDTPTQ